MVDFSLDPAMRRDLAVLHHQEDLDERGNAGG